MPTIEEVTKSLNKKFNSGSVSMGVKFQELERIPFSSPNLNYMSYGGIPMKRAIELAGQENGGKTTLSLDIVKNAQIKYPNRRVLFVDVEATFDSAWATTLGVDTEALLYYLPESQSAEDVFDVILEYLATGEVCLVVVDSLAAMVSEKENENDMHKQTMAGISGVLSRFCRKLPGLLTRHNASFIGINQLRDDLSSMFGGTKTTGGRMWKHTCTVRFTVKKGVFADEKGAELKRSAENPDGNRIDVYLEKTKAFKSNRRVGSCFLNYLEGIDYISDIIDLSVKSGFIEQSGAWFKINDYGEPLKIQGKVKLKEELQNNKELLEALVEDVNKYVVAE